MEVIFLIKQLCNSSRWEGSDIYATLLYIPVKKSAVKLHTRVRRVVGRICLVNYYPNAITSEYKMKMNDWYELGNKFLVHFLSLKPLYIGSQKTELNRRNFYFGYSVRISMILNGLVWKEWFQTLILQLFEFVIHN